MANYMIPTDLEFVTDIGKAIARERLGVDSRAILADSGVPDQMVEMLDASIDSIFERLWNGSTEFDSSQRASYIADARSAINAINLKLLLNQ